MGIQMRELRNFLFFILFISTFKCKKFELKTLPILFKAHTKIWLEVNIDSLWLSAELRKRDQFSGGKNNNEIK